MMSSTMHAAWCTAPAMRMGRPLPLCRVLPQVRPIQTEKTSTGEVNHRTLHLVVYCIGESLNCFVSSCRYTAAVQ